MSEMTYYYTMSPHDKPIVWLHGEVASPPLSKEVRLEAGYLLRLLQKGENLSLPHSRPMPSIGKNCHELRVQDKQKTWRILYLIDSDAIVILEVFEKKTQQTPNHIIQASKNRLKQYNQL
jgi:phage-related protein